MRTGIALAVSAEIEGRGGTAEDRLVAAALGDRGLETSIVAWDREVDWSGFEGVFVRSCWDYHLWPREFRRWLERLEAVDLPVWNPLPLLRWNIDKRYLAELAQRGVPVVPTLFVDGELPTELPGWLSDEGGGQVVLKPSIGATAHATERLDAAVALERLRGRSVGEPGVWLLQPFLEEVVREGEWSLLWIAGAFRHAVVKRPGAGDYRVQEEWGGSVERREPDESLLGVAREMMSGLEPEPLVARVDLVRRGGEPLLMELELIEPQLFLEEGDAGLEALARAIDSTLD